MAGRRSKNFKIFSSGLKAKIEYDKRKGRKSEEVEEFERNIEELKKELYKLIIYDVVKQVDGLYYSAVDAFYADYPNPKYYKVLRKNGKRKYGRVYGMYRASKFWGHDMRANKFNKPNVGNRMYSYIYTLKSDYIYKNFNGNPYKGNLGFAKEGINMDSDGKKIVETIFERSFEKGIHGFTPTEYYDNSIKTYEDGTPYFYRNVRHKPRQMRTPPYDLFYNRADRFLKGQKVYKLNRAGRKISTRSNYRTTGNYTLKQIYNKNFLLAFRRIFKV